MNGPSFEKLVNSIFSPFLKELGFVFRPALVSGRYYRSSFVSLRHTLLVTFEPGEERADVMLLSNEQDDLHSIDDLSKTPRLSDLNARYMRQVTASERAENEAHFEQLGPYDDMERGLLKYAKDLRLVLPLHLRVDC